MPKNWVKYYEPLDLNGNQYVPYCTFRWHQGLVKKEYVNQCLEKQCHHLRLLSIREKEGNLSKKCE